MEVVFVIEVILTVFFSLRHIKEFTQRVKEFYSNEKEKELVNIQISLFFMIATAFVGVISNIIFDKHLFNNNHYLIELPSLAHSVVIFGLCFAGYRQTFSIKQLHNDQFETVEELTNESKELMQQKENVVFEDKQDELFDRMEQLLNGEKIFKNSDLRLNDVVLKLGSNRTYVSQLINVKANTNFSDYINSHRIDYAKKMLSSQEGEHLSLEEIALEAGFSSKSSFYRLFAKIEGTTPSRYRKKNLIENCATTDN